MDHSDPRAIDDFSPSYRPKRRRLETYGATSTHSSDPSGDDDFNDPVIHHPLEDGNRKLRLSYTESEQGDNHRLSSDYGSSPKDDDYKYESKESDSDDDGSPTRPNFQITNDNMFYNNDETDEADDSKLHGVIKDAYSQKAQKMMAKMGYQPGKGLGREEQGRAEPVEASTQKVGRAGLGLKPSTVGELPRDFKWSSDDAVPEAREEVSWLPSAPTEPLTGDQLDEWLETKKKKLTIDDETEFVDPQILKGVLEAKTIFDSLNDDQLRNARFRSNPYETIGAVIFLNRAAVKMANLDAIYDYMFTMPKKQSNEQQSAVEKREILYFADVCAGPGGFSEYVLYRLGWKAKGFGFTLKSANDFKLSDFYAGTPESFNPYYGENGDGDIYDPDNLTSLKDHVLKQTDDKGVHFLMADGGFSVEGQENIQEILSKQLYLCQCLAALMLVRTGGHFVVKLFDVFTLFSVGLIYIMYRCFDKVSIHKPVTSRPANSERYLVCKWKRLGTEPAEQHLFRVNSLLLRNRGSEQDVNQLVPLAVIQEDTAFFEYIYNSNCRLGDKQIKNLIKIAAFSKDNTLKESSQADMREQCLKLWNLPDEVRKQPERMSADDTLSSILSKMAKRPAESHGLHSFKSTVLNRPPDYLEQHSDLRLFKNVYEWHMIFLSSAKNSPDLKFFIGCGGKQVYQLDGARWTSAAELHFTLPARTLIYGELVREYRGEGTTQMHSKALHIIDAVMLGGVDVSQMPYNERINQCSMFCDALSKPFDKTCLHIRCKRLYNMEQFHSAMNNLEFRSMKRVKKAVTIDIPNRVSRVEMFHTIGSVLFIKELKEPWEAHFSKKTGYKYYFRIENMKPRSEYYIPHEAALDTISAHSCRVLWPWEPHANAIFDGQPHEGITRAQVEDFIAHKIAK